MPARSSSWSASGSRQMPTKCPETRVRAVRACASPNSSIQEPPHEIPSLAAACPARVVVRRAGHGRASDLCPAQGARNVRAPGETQCGARCARYGVGTPAAGTELLVLERLRRKGGERQAANDTAANPRRADSAAVKLRSGDNDAQAKSYRWRSTVILGAVLLGAAGLVARAVELQLLDHGFLAKQGDDRSMR